MTTRLSFVSLSRRELGLRVEWIVTAVTVIGVLTILARRATGTGLWCDELLFLHATEKGCWASLMTPGSSHPPLMRLLVYPLVAAGATDGLLRLPSVLASGLAVIVWSVVLRRIVTDRITRMLTLPTMSLSVAWLGIGFQLVPYAVLMLLAAVHTWAWLRMLDRGRFSWPAAMLVAATGAAAAWTHFFGINLLIAGQAAWLLLWLSGRVTLRQWTWTAVTQVVLTAPVVPLACFYSAVDGPYVAAGVDSYTAYLHAASQLIFARTTLFGFRIAGPVYLLPYVLIVGLLIAACRGKRQAAGASGGVDRRDLAVPWIGAGLLLAGVPAMQLHGWLAGNVLWERYALLGAWLHWPLGLWLASRWFGPLPARGLAAVGLCAGLFALSLGSAANSEVTRDYDPVVEHLGREARTGDAFWAQDLDIWTGAGNFDRLWFQRYAHGDLPVLTGPPMLRRDLLDAQLPFATAPADVRRIWAFSVMYNESMLERLTPPGWRLQFRQRLGRNYPLACWVRDP